MWPICADGEVFVVLNMPAKAGDIGGENGCNVTFGSAFFHLRTCLQVNLATMKGLAIWPPGATNTTTDYSHRCSPGC